MLHDHHRFAANHAHGTTHRAGDSVADILQSYPHLSASAVHDAMSYYLDHLTEIEQEIAENRLENVLPKVGAQLDERGFVTFPAQSNND